MQVHLDITSQKSCIHIGMGTQDLMQKIEQHKPKIHQRRPN